MEMIKDFFRGTVIGVANIIPGVSGGTLALVLGIYERLITAIGNISVQTIISTAGLLRFKRENLGRFKTEMKNVDAMFLVRIAAGAVIAIVALAKLMTFLLKDWHDPTYGFFFGLILASAVAPYRLIKKKTFTVFLAGIIAMASVIGLSYSMSGDKLIKKAEMKQEMKLKEESGQDLPAKKTIGSLEVTEIVHTFFMGAISISAMVLPGVSGSFVLLLMGGYFYIISAISPGSVNPPIIAIFGLGCLFGIVAFTRLLKFLLRRFYNQTMGFLLGLVIGSLWMIWPFKTSRVIGDETIYLSNRIPESFSKLEIYTVIAALAGIVIVAILILIEMRSEREHGQGNF